jgi:hypothetical protein
MLEHLDMVYHRRLAAIALGCFDATFPPPTIEFFTKFSAPWVTPNLDADQIYDPMGADDERAWRAADPAGPRPDA